MDRSFFGYKQSFWFSEAHKGSILSAQQNCPMRRFFYMTRCTHFVFIFRICPQKNRDGLNTIPDWTYSTTE
jgi:hypothetical protein